ncbi:hypothetical protein B0H16DRAFT_1698030, partial [Mycena metata]
MKSDAHCVLSTARRKFKGEFLKDSSAGQHLADLATGVDSLILESEIQPWFLKMYHERLILSEWSPRFESGAQLFVKVFDVDFISQVSAPHTTWKWEWLSQVSWRFLKNLGVKTGTFIQGSAGGCEEILEFPQLDDDLSDLEHFHWKMVPTPTNSPPTRKRAQYLGRLMPKILQGHPDTVLSRSHINVSPADMDKDNELQRPNMSILTLHLS